MSDKYMYIRGVRQVPFGSPGDPFAATRRCELIELERSLAADAGRAAAVDPKGWSRYQRIGCAPSRFAIFLGGKQTIAHTNTASSAQGVLCIQRLRVR